jgi:Glycine rich protein/SprB repeat/Secretion system C-terminal sorting domain
MKKSLLLKAQLLALAVFAFSQSNAQTVTFNYTGALQTYTVPPGATSITVDVYGAQGGLGYNVPNVGAGLGGRVQATVAVTPGEILNIYVGGQGGPGGTTIGGTAGYNGGGVGGGWSGGRSGGGGGGASDIRQGGTALSNRVVIGAGGGGTGVNFSSGNRGGDGGGLTGANGLTGTYLGAGATQSAGGAPNGVLGAGGNAPGGQTGGGGGGGYYGGGSSAWEGGGGGSSYTTPVIVTSVVHTGGSRSGNGQIIITPVIVFNATISQTASILCNGQSTAALTAAPVGGTGPFTYSWAPSGGNAATASGLAAGTYTVTVTDGSNSSTVTQTFTITQPSAISVTATSTGNLCNGGNAGTATAVVSGGSPGYTYVWSNGGTTATITNLIAGAYTYTVTDVQGCSASQSVTVTQPNALAATTMQTNVSCNGGSNGDAMVMVTGGTGAYTYFWAPSGGTASTASGLVAGTYSCTITDANSCTMTQTFSIIEPAILSVSSTSGTIACNGDSTTIALAASGGTGPYTGEGSFTVAAGTHTFVITDANGCTATTTVSLTEPTAIVATVSSTSISCNGSNDGTATATVSGGTPGYTYLWSNGATTSTVNNLSIGAYTYTVTDVQGCTATQTVSITEPAALVATAVSTNPTTCGGTDGMIDVTLSGGTPGYNFLWSNNATTEDITGVGAGSYTCMITDLNGCITQVAGTLSDPAAPTVTVALAIDTVCVSDGLYTLNGGSPAGGTFSGPGVTGTSFNPSVATNGLHTITYSYTDAQTGCSASNTDIIFVDACVGVNPVSANEQNFTVFPNPNNGIFTLQLNTTEIATVLIYDAVGQLVSSNKVQPNTQQQINLESAGVYMITVLTADGKQSSQRVIVTE